MGTWLRAPRAERALLGATWHRPRSILHADLPRCGAEPRAGVKAVLRGVGGDNWGPEGPYGHCSRAAAERCGARRLRSELRATLSCFTRGTSPSRDRGGSRTRGAETVVAADLPSHRAMWPAGAGTKLPCPRDSALRRAAFSGNLTALPSHLVPAGRSVRVFISANPEGKYLGPVSRSFLRSARVRKCVGPVQPGTPCVSSAPCLPL